MGRPKGQIATRTRDLNILFNAAFGDDVEFNKLIERAKHIIHNGNDRESAALLRYVFDRLLGKVPDVITHNVHNDLTIDDILSSDEQ